MQIERGFNMKNLVSNSLALDSREVAKMLPKAHAHLLRDIETYQAYLGESKIGFTDFWQEGTYKTTQNKIMKCYLITKKGCEFLAHKMTGKKGTIFTATYINRFHDMELALQEKPILSPAQQAPQIHHYVYEGIPVIHSFDMGVAISVSYSTLLSEAKYLKQTIYMLKGIPLIKFKRENNIYGRSSSSMALFPKQTALALLEHRGIADECQDIIENYFSVPAIPAPAPRAVLPAAPLPQSYVVEKIKQLDILSRTLHSIKSYEERSEAARYISHELMAMGLWKPQHLEDNTLDWNTPDGWNKYSVLQDAKCLIHDNRPVTRAELALLHEEVNQSIARLMK